MEGMYKLFLGEIKPKIPTDSFRLQVWLLKHLGLWAPDTENPTVQFLYKIFSYFYRWFFLYIYTITQILFFLNVESLNEVAEGFFLLLTQLALIYKVEKFYANRHRIKNLDKILKSTMFRPQNEEEDSVVKEAMAQSFAFGMSFLVLAHLTISTWAIFPFFEDNLRFPIAAWYPFSTDNSMIFGLMYFYQIFGISMSACFNVSTDTIASGMIAHANSQVRRLGIILSKVGYEVNKKSKIMLTDDKSLDQQIIEVEKEIKKIKTLKSENYGEVARCIIFHDNILKFSAEIEDVFKGPIFAQLAASCIIICMTCFILSSPIENPVAYGSMIGYLLCMINQILLFCWIGNEIIFSSNDLIKCAYLSNFKDFDRPTAKALLLFMERSFKEINMKAGIIFNVTLSLPTFMSVLKSSYSYFAVLQTMQEDKN